MHVGNLISVLANNKIAISVPIEKEKEEEVQKKEHEEKVQKEGKKKVDKEDQVDVNVEEEKKEEVRYLFPFFILPNFLISV